MTEHSIPVPGTRSHSAPAASPAPAPWLCRHGCEPGHNAAPRELSPSDLLAGSDTDRSPMALGDTHGSWMVIAVKWVKAEFENIKAGIAINGEVPRYDLECACGTIVKNRNSARNSLRCAHCRTIEKYTIPLYELTAIFGRLYYAVTSDNPHLGFSRITEIGYRYYDGALEIITGYYIDDSDWMAAL